MTITTGIMTFTPDAKSLCGKLPDLDGLCPLFLLFRSWHHAKPGHRRAHG